MQKPAARLSCHLHVCALQRIGWFSLETRCAQEEGGSGKLLRIFDFFKHGLAVWGDTFLYGVKIALLSSKHISSVFHLVFTMKLKVSAGVLLTNIYVETLKVI